MKPRRAQERHSHPELMTGSGGSGDPTRRVYRAVNFNGALASCNNFLTGITVPGGATYTEAGGGSDLASRSAYSRAVTTTLVYTYTDPYPNIVDGFVCRVQFGVAAYSGTTTLWAGLTDTTTGAEYQTWSTCTQSVGVVASMGSAFQWSSCTTSGSGAQTASGLTAAADTMYDLVLDCPKGGPIVGTLTDMESGSYEQFTFPGATTPSDRMLRLSVKSQAAVSHTLRVCRMDIVEFL